MKKKGLIISTIVMVVVLVASLTTATYAWFSSTASATVDDLTIQTQAAAGLQIAMTNQAGSIDNIVSGELEYSTGGVWTGASQTWGSFLGFNNVTIGEIENAVTYINAGESINSYDGLIQSSVYNAGTAYYTRTEIPPSTTVPSASVFSTYYVFNTPYYTRNTADFDSTTTYYTFALVAEPTAGAIASYYEDHYTAVTVQTSDAGYYVPTGYNSAMQPTGYQKAMANGEYYSLTMAVSNLKAVQSLGVSIIVTPSGTSNIGTVSNTNPGMAAATRIAMSVSKASETAKSATLAPFSAWKLQNNNTMNSTTTSNGYNVDNDGVVNNNGKYTCVIDSVEGGTGIAANQVYYVNMIIWVEGTDAECDNKTTGTEMTFQISFEYAEVGGTINWGDATDGTTVALV